MAMISPRTSISLDEGSRYGLHDPPNASTEVAPATVFGDLFHALGYLLGRGVWPQFRTHRAYSRRQVHLGLAPAANAGPVNPPAWEMAFRTSGHAEGRGHGDGRLDTRLRGWRLRIRPTAKLRMQQPVLINAPCREPALLDKPRCEQDSQAPPHLAFADSAARPDFRMSHLDRTSVKELGRQGGKHQLCCRWQIAAQDVLRQLGPAPYRGRGSGQFVRLVRTI